MSGVEAHSVTKRFGEFVALDNVSVSFEEGKLFGLLGPSGSGKTTLLRLIAGFLRPEGGQITIQGKPIDDVPVHRRDIGMVFQNYALFPHMSVYDNIAFGLTTRSAPSAEIGKKVGEMLDLVDLVGLEKRRPSQLSGGQQQRVALARALVTRPRVLLLDEPLAALDRRLRQRMQVELRQIQQTVGITTIFVTHDQEEALTLSDRVAIFEKGTVLQVGSPDDVYERPCSRFAAGFLGDANFIEARMTAGGTGEAEGLGRFTVADGAPVSGSKVTLAVRPEKIRIVASAGPASPESNRLSARVESKIFSGSSIVYRTRLHDGRLFLVFIQNAGQPLPEPGEAVALEWERQSTIPLLR